MDVEETTASKDPVPPQPAVRIPSDDEVDRQHRRLLTYKLGEYWLRPSPPRESPWPEWLRKQGIQQPDITRNLGLLFHHLSYGHESVRQLRHFIRGLGSDQQDSRVLVVGDCAPWILWEVVSAHPQTPVHAIVKDRRSADWAQEHIKLRGSASQDWVTVQHGYGDLSQIPGEKPFTAIIWAFVSDSKQQQQTLLQHLLALLTPQARIYYAEACQPSENNLEKWSRFRYRTSGVRSTGRDRWSFRRELSEQYQEDALRVFAFRSEEKLWHSLLDAGFETESHGFVRPTLDTGLSNLTVAQRRYFQLYLIAWLAFDWICASTGWLEGTRRIAVLGRPAQSGSRPA